MGEMTFEQTVMLKAVATALVERSGGGGDLCVSTPGGRFQVRWDENGSASALGQLAFFAEFLDVSGLFERWAASCPMSYTSNNAPKYETFWAPGCSRFSMASTAMRTSPDCAGMASPLRYWA